MRELELSCKRIVPIYTITDIRELVQFVGYCKYINADNYNVYIYAFILVKIEGVIMS